MSLISGSYPSLINGVSQQPPLLRLPSQGQTQVNAYSSLSEGLMKRPPSRYVATLLQNVKPHPHVHFINRDKREQYVLIFQSDGSLAVFGLDGQSYPVAIGGTISPSPWHPYLVCDRPQSDLVCLTLADTTYVLNREKVVQTEPLIEPEDDATQQSLASGGKFVAQVTVRQGAYAAKYTISVGGTVVTHETPPGTAEDQQTAEANEKAIQTDHIASELVALLQADPALSGWTIQQHVNDILLQRPDYAPFPIEVLDSQGNRLITVLRNEVTRFSDLPAQSVHWKVVKVRGNAESGDDDYWVRFRVHNHAPFGSGVWEECRSPEVSNSWPRRLKASTMPHIITRKQLTEPTGDFPAGTIYFDIEEASWADPLVGDRYSNPLPSFVGRKITGLSLYRNRLGILSGNNYTTSRTGDFGDFFRATARQLQDDDPIDTPCAHPLVNTLWYATPFDEDLILFADKAQFVVRGGDALTPRTIKIEPYSAYDFSATANPINIGDRIYFAQPNGRWGSVMELSVMHKEYSRDVDPITAHVPAYIPGAIQWMAGSTVFDVLVVNADGDPRSLYIYKYFFNGQERVQSSWSRWTLGTSSATTQIAGGGFWLQWLYLVVVRNGTAYLERISFDTASIGAVGNCSGLLDREVSWASLPMEFDPATGTTKIFLPYDPEEDPIVVVGGDCQGATLPNPYCPGDQVPVWNPTIGDYECRPRNEVSCPAGTVPVLNTYTGQIECKDPSEVPGGGDEGCPPGYIEVINAETGEKTCLPPSEDQEPFRWWLPLYLCGTDTPSGLFHYLGESFVPNPLKIPRSMEAPDGLNNYYIPIDASPVPTPLGVNMPTLQGRPVIAQDECRQYLPVYACGETQPAYSVPADEVTTGRFYINGELYETHEEDEPSFTAPAPLARVDNHSFIWGLHFQRAIPTEDTCDDLEYECRDVCGADDWGRRCISTKSVVRVSDIRILWRDHDKSAGCNGPVVNTRYDVTLSGTYDLVFDGFTFEGAPIWIANGIPVTFVYNNHQFTGTADINAIWICSGDERGWNLTVHLYAGGGTWYPFDPTSPYLVSHDLCGAEWNGDECDEGPDHANLRRIERAKLELLNNKCCRDVNGDDYDPYYPCFKGEPDCNSPDCNQ